MTLDTATSDAISRLDDGHARPGDLLAAEAFERHCQDDWARIELRPNPLPADVCACGEVKEPGEHECNRCFLDFDDQMRRAADV